MVIGVPDVIEYVRAVMVAGTVALPETEEMSGLSTDKESSVKYVTLWLQRLCEEDDEDEVGAWLEAILKAGFRSKNRLRLMVSVDQLVALGVNWVAATNTFERLLRDFIRETNLKSKLKANSSRVEYSLAVFRVERLCR